MTEKKRGIVLINTGTPDSYHPKDVKRFLKQFLMDPRVISIPKPLRYLLVNGIIAPFRVGRSSKKYKSIWTPQGSPLILYTEALRQNLETALKLPVVIGMRYGTPSMNSAIELLVKAGVEEVIGIPLFPHYAMSSFETAAVHFLRCAKGKVKASVLPPYFGEPAYLEALTQSIRPFYSDEEDKPLLLFSFHGIPMSHVEMYRDNPDKDYLIHCYKTVEGVTKALELKKGEYEIAYQSRLGKGKWLSPHTAQVLAQLPKRGVKNVVVVCPSFITDCLETLEEIVMEGSCLFTAHGGQTFHVAPCLNSRADYLVEILRDKLSSQDAPLLGEKELPFNV